MKYVFNSFNIFLMAIYITISLVMSIGSAASFVQNTGSLFFEIILLIIWGTIFTYERKQKKLSPFSFDFFVMTYVFVVAIMIGLMFEDKNPDVLGWWPVMVVLGCIFGLGWSLIFSGFAALLKSHEKYTKYFALLMVTGLILILASVSHHVMSEKYLYYFLSFTLIMHATLCIYEKFRQLFL